MNDNQMILAYFKDLEKRAKKSHLKHQTISELFNETDNLELRDLILEKQRNELERYIELNNEIMRISKLYSKVVYPCNF